MKSAGSRSTLISASAGSGKTYQLAGRFLRVLLEPAAKGGKTDPTTVLATTFTRAAAGEILSRVLSWLAWAVFDPQRRSQLGKVLGASREPSATECAVVLEEMTERLHRLQIGTMDGIFARVVRSFGSAAGMPPVWSIAEPEKARQLAEQAVDEMLAGKEGPRIKKAWRVFRGKAPALGLRAQLMENFEEPRFDLRGYPSDGSWEKNPGPKRMETAECSQLLGFLHTFASPKSKHWTQSLFRLQQQLSQNPLWIDLIEEGPMRKLALGLNKYDKTTIPQDFVDQMGPVAAKAKAEVVRLHQLRNSALLALAGEYDRARSRQSYVSGIYTFREIEVAALKVAVGCQSDELYFRLDGRMEHLLLDEFQDTSRGQFAFFHRILGETVAKGGQVLVVGDRKQSIYGWRGSDPRLMGEVAKVLPGVELKNLSESFRSSPAVLAAVDRAFTDLANSPLLAEKPELALAARSWCEGYQKHISSERAAGQSGRVDCWVQAGEDAAEIRDRVRAKVVERAREHVRMKEGSLGILCRTHALIPGILAGLKREGVEASGEGGNPLVDSAAVEMILSLLSWADHPGHSAGRYHVVMGGMAEVFGCEKVSKKKEGKDEEASRFLGQLRKEVVEKGLAEVVGGWIAQRQWKEAGTAHDRMRCGQLVELARAFDAEGGGRLAEFVRRVRSERVENPQAASVRVMTVHGAKGLEFDRVILADLDRVLGGGGRDKPKIRVSSGGVEVLPNSDTAEILGCSSKLNEVKGEEFMEALSVLYVGLTRARRDLEVVVGRKQKGEGLSLGKILRTQWGWQESMGEAELVVEHSQAKKVEPTKEPKVPIDAGVAVHLGKAPRVTSVRLGLESPSSREGGGRVKLGQVISQGSGRALSKGTRVHQWLSQVEWLEGAGPAAKEWVAGSVDLWRGMERAEVEREASEVAAKVRGEMGWVFRKEKWEGKWAGATNLEVWREKSFAVVWEREGKREVLTGTFDRVVVGREPKGKVVGAEVVDFKTDQVGDETQKKERAEYYRPQLEAYAAAVSKLTGLAPEKVSTRIAWVWAA